MNYSYQEELLENWPHRGEGSGSDDSCCVASEQAVRRDTLLEHWPKRKSSFMNSFDLDEDDAALASISNKRHHHARSVNFSGSSSLHVFERESFYLLQSLAYTKEDYDVFGKEALREGFRIKSLIADVPYDSEAKSIKYLLSHGIINREEMIGIEHFVLDKPSRVYKTRKQHSKAVLRKQEQQQGQQLEDPAFKLGEFARSNSLRSSKRAKIRAAMAA